MISLTSDDHRFTRQSIWYLTAPPSSWVESAKCASPAVNPNLFTECSTPAQLHAARAVCAGCPVRQECLAYGTRTKADGVWGGELLHDGRTRQLRRLG